MIIAYKNMDESEPVIRPARGWAYDVRMNSPRNDLYMSCWDVMELASERIDAMASSPKEIPNEIVPKEKRVKRPHPRKVTKEIAESIRDLVSKGMSQKCAGAKYGLSSTAAWAIVHRHSWGK